MKKQPSILELKYRRAYSCYRKYHNIKRFDSRTVELVNDILTGALNELAYIGIGINADGEMYRSTFDYLIRYKVNGQYKHCTLHRITHCHMLDFSHRLKEHYHATDIYATELETNYRYNLGGYEA